MLFPVVVNCRAASADLSGVPRYVYELCKRLPAGAECVSPRYVMSGMANHSWEQLVLPKIVKDGLLFSPANTGPLCVKRQVLTIHDLATHDHPEWTSLAFSSWYKFLTGRLSENVKKIIAVSEYTKSRIVKVLGIPPSKVSVVHNGVDLRFFMNWGGFSSKVMLGFPSDRYILGLNSLEPRKNVDSLLQAWEVVHKKLPSDVWLVLGGRIGDSRIFGKYGFKSVPPRVHFAGHVPDEHLPALYSHAIYFVYVSLYEGFGLPPLEAMASGAPTLVSNVTSLPEVVGDAGILVNPYDVNAIAEGMRRMFEDVALREMLRIRGRERAKLFTWDRTAELTWQVLQEAAEQE